MKTIDLDSWPRASQFTFFRQYANPHYALTARIDVTRLISDDKPAGVSVFNGALFAIMAAVNAVPELRTRFSGDKVCEYEIVHASVTVPIDGDQFAFCDIPFSHAWPEFDRNCRQVIDAARRQVELKNNVAGSQEWTYLTCLPWVHFTAMTHPVDGPADCIPRIAWGKIESDAGRWFMPVAIQVHHALVDGRHVGQFFEVLQERMQHSLQAKKGGPQ
jgi:chloramphenicol O-acetyltransferase type A